MVYGYEIEDTAGNKSFFTEGCVYCHMSTGGKHEDNCPMNDIERPAKIPNIRTIREDMKANNAEKGG